ncbi:ribonuclease FAU-1 family protein [Pontibacillus marinus]|uniref:DUF402 domain-containing protein n=1 Tax=Pontibacillus marinus BH030004 = DSM 16465 TaxID=1385511 RepID=A0A0A5GB05_9BACI|nr:DUF402 domain-containing protein [Pontibacillus marinus]KGX88300.1 hypothetical protein N783_08590 [Pontibacillus marinus BH030004 = DSM 16465]
MKVKYADRSHWNRVKERSFSVHHENSESFQGAVAVLHIHKVQTRLVIPYEDSNICIADDGYVWVQHFPKGEHFTVTAMINQNGNVVQWYIDMIHAYGETEDGIPWYEDLYLDVVALPNGGYYTLDHDELDAAWRLGDITREQYDLALRTHRKVTSLLELGQFDILREAEKWVGSDEI